MRFIVDLYRWLVLLGIGCLLIGVVYAGLKIATAEGDFGPFTGVYVAIAFAVFIGIVLAFGLTAAFISIHDRHCELVDELRRMRESLQSHGDQ
ncbi:hypothetical protein [Allosphingosinicella humi]